MHPPASLNLHVVVQQEGQLDVLPRYSELLELEVGQSGHLPFVLRVSVLEG